MTVTASAHPLTGTQRLLAFSAGSYPDHVGQLGEVPRLTVSELIALAEGAGLTGRGGAGFPTARKISAVAASGRRPVVVGNAMEGEYLSHKDRVLLEVAPHLVLDGLEVLGTTLGARRTILGVGHGTSSQAVRAARVGRHGTRVDVRDLEGGFVAGQESALVSQLNDHAPVPSDNLTPVYVSGVGGRPTLVVNAETLAQLGLLARFGADWFRSQGTLEDPGTFLVTVTGSNDEVVRRPGVLEFPRGVGLREVLLSASVRVDLVGAVLIGGYHGTWLPASALDTPLSRDGLGRYGASTGAGVLHVLDARRCPLRVSANIAAYLAKESAGQCGPCVNGLPRMADTLGRLAALRADRRLVVEVGRLRRLVVGRGACAHPDGTARFVASTMRVFADHVDDHLRGVCRASSAH